MKRLGRRDFFKAGAVLGAAAGTSLTFGRAAASSRTYRRHSPAIVIGSGFGGSVAALRLGRAGIPTLLVERGKHWPLDGADSFPTTATAATDPRASWLAEPQPGQPSNRYTGLLERISGDTTGVMVGAGVGGGSLVFGGTLLQPKRDLFEQVFPRIDYDAMDEVFYPRVLSRIGGGPIPDDVLESPNYAACREMIASATAAGFEIVRSDVCFDWDIIRDEIAGRVAPAASVGEYVFGCISGAKNSLDKNYLVDAQGTGKVEILALHQVTLIAGDGVGCYEVHCDVLETDGTVVAQRVLTCEHLFLAAGSINTTKLLLKAKAAGSLPGVNGAVGKFWGNNGDYLIGRAGVSAPLGIVQGGPPNIIAYDDSDKPLAFVHSPSTRPEPLQLHMSMSIPEQLGEVLYDAATDRASVRWPFAANAPSHEQYQSSMQKIIAVSGGTLLPQEQLGPTGASAWHPLGGAVMGEACSELGELHGQPNLYVVDGSLLPGSAAGANPSLTIAANAERIFEKLVRKLA